MASPERIQIYANGDRLHLWNQFKKLAETKKVSASELVMQLVELHLLENRLEDFTRTRIAIGGQEYEGFVRPVVGSS